MSGRSPQAPDEAPSAGGRTIALAALVAVVALVAALTHFVAILLLPSVATRDAYALLAARAGGTNRLAVLPPSRPGDAPIPFRDPATIQGLCVYDIGSAPVRVKLSVEPDRLLTLSFRTPDGRVFYSLTDRAASKGTIDIRLVSEAQLRDIEDADDEDQGLPSELRLKVPTRKGLMVATALIARPDEADAARREIEAISCAPEPLPPPQE